MDMERVKILFLTNWYPTRDNPVQGIFFKEQAIALKEFCDFFVCHYRSVEGEQSRMVLCGEEENIHEYEVVLSASSTIGFLKRRILRTSYSWESELETKLIGLILKEFKHKIDVLYCVSAQKEARFVAALAEKWGKPYIVAEHGPVPWPDSIISEANKRAIERADLLLAISYDKLRQIMMQGIRIPEYVYVGNMVDDTHFQYLPKKHEIKTFMIVAAHVFYKNYDMLIDIMNRLKNKTKVPFRLMIVGYNANRTYSKDADVLERKIQKSSFAHCVEMIPFADRSKIPELYNRADAFVMTSIQEGMPVSALEAGCCGLPIFSTRCGGVEDYVTERIGRIYGLFDSEEFSDGLCDYLEGRIEFDPEHIRRCIVNQFGKTAFVENMRKAFVGVIEKRTEIKTGEDT